MDKKQLRICGISDLHGHLPKIDECDALIIAGDIVPLECQRSSALSNEWFLNEFKDWVEEIPCSKVYFIAGNHDFYLQRLGKEGVRGLIGTMVEEGLPIGKLIYLEDDSAVMENGATIYGCPWCKGPFGLAFSPNDTLVDVSPKYEAIPDCDILICHQPPAVGKLGCSYPNTSIEKDWGSDKLREAIYNKHIGSVICGHIHSGEHGGIKYPTYGCDTTFYNVSILNEDYNVYYQPTYLILD